MKISCTLALLTLFVGGPGATALAAEVAETELMLAATELGRQYDANYAAKNSGAMAALYAPDGVLVSPSGAILRGREALATYYASRFAAGARGHTIKIIETHIQGNGGYSLAQFSVAAPRANGDLREVHGNIVAVYQRDPDGWHLRLVDASVPPPPDEPGGVKP